MSVSSEKFELAADDLDSALERVAVSIDTIDNRISKVSSATASRASSWLTLQASWREAESRARSELVESRRMLQEMDGEARMAPPAYRSEMLEKVRSGRESISRAQTRMTEIGARLAKMQQQNLIGASGDPTSVALTVDEIHRRQVEEGSGILERTSQSILRSQQVALESEEIGGEVVSDLGVQRETLERARNRLQETNAEISRSRKVIRRIYFGVIQNKAVLIAVIIVEVAIVCALVYWKFIAK